MNYAICISGELRTGIQAWATNLELFRDSPHTHVFFFEIWEKSTNPRRADSFPELLLNVLLGKTRTYAKLEPVESGKVEALFDGFQEFFLNIHPSEHWDKEIPTISNLPEGRLKNKILGSMRMFFMIEECDKRRIQFEQSQGVQFDGVLRVRPDSILLANPFELLSESKADLLFFRDPNEDRFIWGPVNDQVYVGTSEVMKKVSKVYSGVKQVGESIGWFLPSGSIHEVLVAESALSWHVSGLRTEYRVVSSKVGTKLLRPRVVTRKISPELQVKRQDDFLKLSKHFVKQFLSRLFLPNQS